MTTAVRQRFKLSPSDLTFLWDECPRCFYEKCHGVRQRPRTAFPSVFNRIDKANRGFYAGKSTAWVSPSLPPGVLECSEQFLRSQDITVPGHDAACWISGKTDCIARFDDGTFGLIDFKTANPGDGHTALYIRQLWAYVYCMEHPAKDSPQLAPVTHMGLLCIQPETMQMLIGDKPACLLNATPVWKPRKADEDSFLRFVGRVLDVLEPPEPPESAAACQFCAYRTGDGR
jgi:hypothetical protein